VKPTGNWSVTSFIGSLSVLGLKPFTSEIRGSNMKLANLSPVGVLILICGCALYFIDWDYVRALNFGVVYEYRLALLRGLGVTLLYTVGAFVVGYFLGILITMTTYLRYKPVVVFVTFWVEFWRDTPLLVQLFWMHFALPAFTGVNTTISQSCFIALSANVAAYQAEIVRSGINAIPIGQWEAAFALGLKSWIVWLRVILPQAVRLMIAPSANLVLGIFKSSAILAILGVGELMRVTISISNYTFRVVELYSTSGLIYVVIGLLISWAAGKVEAAYRQPGYAT
jgi:polar amino acid transport system permease protein